MKYKIFTDKWYESLSPFEHLTVYNLTGEVIRNEFKLLSYNTEVFLPFYNEFKGLLTHNPFEFDINLEKVSKLIEILDLEIEKNELKKTAKGKRAEFGKIYKAVKIEMLKNNLEICVFCKTEKKITIDHIIPLSKGGTNDLSNLQFLCHSCNSKKSAKYEAIS
jgi:hypothetical protein